jgi:hypothetical protein
MDRVPYLEQMVSSERSKQIALYSAQNDEGRFADYDPLDTPMRADICPGTVLKVDDDVELYQGGLYARVLCPADGRGWFVGWWIDRDLNVPNVGTLDMTQISNRAPADPNEPAGTNAPGDPFSIVIATP